MDLHAFKQRILPVQGRLFRLAQLFLRNREEAEDTMQDVLLRLWTNRQQLDTYHSVEALAVQMTKNSCLDRLTAHARQKTA
ncbi:MAG: RNA polymerase subunit sigma-24, partial [Cytophagaceae bacterium]